MPAPRRQPNMLTTIHPGSVGEEGLVLEAAGNSSYPLLDVMWTMFLFFAAVLWFWLIIAILTDVFRRRDMSGWGKAGWTLFVIVLPFVGVLVYMVAQGGQMADRRELGLREESPAYAGPVSVAQGASEISQAKDLLDSGAITTDEYQALKTKALAS
ncbi:MAG: SHOCT domain-containing protein [Actinomycetes bacterium]